MSYLDICTYRYFQIKKKSVSISFLSFFLFFFCLHFVYCHSFFFVVLTGFICFRFLVPSRVKICCLFEIFLLYFLMWAFITIISLLELLLLHLISLVCFISIFICQKVFLSSLLLSSLTHWFFRSVTFSRHICMNFPVFLFVIDFWFHITVVGKGA